VILSVLYKQMEYISRNVIFKLQILQLLLEPDFLSEFSNDHNFYICSNFCLYEKIGLVKRVVDLLLSNHHRRERGNNSFPKCTEKKIKINSLVINHCLMCSKYFTSFMDLLPRISKLIVYYDFQSYVS